MNIAVIGTGYVGLVSGTCFAEMGNIVICVDNNPAKLKKLQSGKVTIYEPGLELLFERNLEKKRLSFTSDLKNSVLNSEIIFLCLPTPQGEDGSADLQYVLNAAGEIGELLANNNEYRIIVNKSTVPVGTFHKVKEKITSSGYNNFDIVSNPEFLREGYAVEDFMKPDRIVIGAENEKAFSIMRELYEQFVRQGNPIIEMDTASAEVTKYAANSYLALRITYMNQLANLCEKVGADIDNVRKGMGTDSRIGKRFLFAGIGYGGSCFPKDVKALYKTSEFMKEPVTLLKEADEANRKQKLILVDKVLSHFKDIKDKKFAVWGLAFKPNTDDMRDAPSVEIINRLVELGAHISAYDPAASDTAAEVFKDSITFAKDDYHALKDADALLILTEWNEFRNPDFDKIKKLLRKNLIFDGRNIFTPEKMKEEGFTYYSIGRPLVS